MTSTPLEPLLVRPLEAAQLIGVGRTKIYELLGTGALPVVRIGGSVRVPLDALKRWIDQQTTNTRAGI